MNLSSLQRFIPQKYFQHWFCGKHSGCQIPQYHGLYYIHTWPAWGTDILKHVSNPTFWLKVWGTKSSHDHLNKWNFLFYLFFLSIFWPLGLQDLSSPTMDWTQALSSESLNHWTTRDFTVEFLPDSFLSCSFSPCMDYYSEKGLVQATVSTLWSHHMPRKPPPPMMLHFHHYELPGDKNTYYKEQQQKKTNNDFLTWIEQ